MCPGRIRPGVHHDVVLRLLKRRRARNRCEESLPASHDSVGDPSLLRRTGVKHYHGHDIPYQRFLWTPPFLRSTLAQVGRCSACRTFGKEERLMVQTNSLRTGAIVFAMLIAVALALSVPTLSGSPAFPAKSIEGSPPTVATLDSVSLPGTATHARPFHGFCRCSCSSIPNCNTSADCGGAPCTHSISCCAAPGGTSDLLAENRSCGTQSADMLR